MNNKDTNKSVYSTKPEWLRVQQASALFGLGRTKLYELIGSGKIKTVSMRQRGQIKGTRLISYDSLSEFIASQASGGDWPQDDDVQAPPINEDGWQETPNKNQFVRTIPFDEIEEVLSEHYSNALELITKAVAIKKPLIHAIMSDSGERSALLIQLPGANDGGDLKMLSETMGRCHAEATDDSCIKVRNLMSIMNLKIDLPQ